MSSDYATHRNRLIAGLAILVVLLIMVIYWLSTLLQQGSGQAQVGHHSIIPELAYCGSEQGTLCIVSFSQEVDGAMQVNFQTPRALFPEFILTISNNGAESTYECERVENAPTSMICTGASQVPGQILQFKVISKHRGTLLAEGKFAIIGIALMTPEILSTVTLTETPPATTPTPGRTTPSPSYPNPPSYP
ncbi:MAG: hypothetical protein ABI621_08590 [Chloroflexota bacterium]